MISDYYRGATADMIRAWTDMWLDIGRWRPFRPVQPPEPQIEIIE